MKKIIALSMMVFCTNNALFSQDHYRNMVILLDWDTETLQKSLNWSDPRKVKTGNDFGFGAMMGDFLSALLAESSMIVVSSITWENFLGRYKIYNDFKNAIGKAEDLPDGWQDKLEYKHSIYNDSQFFKGRMTSFAETIQYFEKIKEPPEYYKANRITKSFLVCSLVNLDNWEIKKINDFFYCLVPTQYLEKLKQEFDNPNISDDDTLGIKWSEIGEPSNPKDSTSWKLFEREELPMGGYIFKKPEVPASVNELFIDAMRILFKAQTYTEESVVYKWLFYLSGHGSQKDIGGHAQSIIAGLSVETFKNFLQFCNDTILTRFLFYRTCYAGGEHLEIPFQIERTESKKEEDPPVQQPLEYNFYIAVGTLLASKAYSSSLPKITIPMDEDAFKQEMSPKFTEYFNELQKYFFGDPKINLSDIIKLIQVNDVRTSQGTSYQIPVVRFPFTGWFAVADISENVERLTKIKIQAATAEYELMFDELHDLDQKRFEERDPQKGAELEQQYQALKDKFDKKVLLIRAKEVVIINVGKGEKDGILMPVGINCSKSEPPKSPKFIYYTSAQQLTYYFYSIIAPECKATEIFEALAGPIEGARVRVIVDLILCKDDIQYKDDQVRHFQNVSIGVEFEEIIVQIAPSAYKLQRGRVQPAEFRQRRIVPGLLERLKQNQQEDIDRYKQLLQTLKKKQEVGEKPRGKPFEPITGPQVEVKPPKEVKPKPQPKPQPTPQEFPPTGDEIADALNQFAYSLGELAYQVGQ